MPKKQTLCQHLQTNNSSYFARFRNEFEKMLEDLRTLETSVFRAATGWSRDPSKIAKLQREI
jgi:hypothetical protein